MPSRMRRLNAPARRLPDRLFNSTLLRQQFIFVRGKVSSPNCTCRRLEALAGGIAAHAPAWTSPRLRVDSTMLTTIARAFGWRRLLETSAVGTVKEIATKEDINNSYVSRVLRWMAHEIVETILNGRESMDVTASGLMGVFASQSFRQEPARPFGPASARTCRASSQVAARRTDSDHQSGGA